MMQQIVAKRAEAQRVTGWTYNQQYIASKLNDLADPLSRGRLGIFMENARKRAPPPPSSPWTSAKCHVPPRSCSRWHANSTHPAQYTTELTMINIPRRRRSAHAERRNFSRYSVSGRPILPGRPRGGRRRDSRLYASVCQSAPSRGTYMRTWRLWVAFNVLNLGLCMRSAWRIYDTDPGSQTRRRDERDVTRFNPATDLSRAHVVFCPEHKTPPDYFIVHMVKKNTNGKGNDRH